MLIDVAIFGDRNVITKEAKKIFKYKDIIIEIQCMWNVKAKVIPVLVEVTESISKSLRQYLSNIRESTKLRNYKQTKMPYCALHSDCGKC